MNLYYLVSLINSNTYFVKTNDLTQYINDNKHNVNDKLLYSILQDKFIYHIVNRNIDNNDNIDTLILFYKKNKNKLMTAISKCRFDIEYEKRKLIGASNENMLKPVIELIFNVNLIKTERQFCIFDFYTDDYTYIFELKTLVITHNVFIGVNKICCKNMIFVFKCNKMNELYYLEYNTSLFNTFEIREIEMKQKTTFSLMFLIPKRYLIRIQRDDKVVLLNTASNEVNIKSLL